MPSLFGGENDDDNSVFVYYHARSRITGERVADFLGVPGGEDTGSEVDYLIRWGSRAGAGWRPREGVINSRSALRNNSDKLNALEQLDNAGINVPEYVEDRDALGDEIDYPVLGRDEQHSRGEDINLILQRRDDYFGPSSDFFVEYVPTSREYRMHVVGDEVVKVHEKRLRSEADNHPFIRNAETGWRFMEPRETPPPDDLAIDAAGAIGLDFGAVDVVRSEDNEFYVLEVNSAPSLDEANLRRYGEKLAEMVGLDEYPGLEAVDFDEEDDEPEEVPGAQIQLTPG